VRYLHGAHAILVERLAREKRSATAQACFDFLPTRALLDIAGWADRDIFSHDCAAASMTTQADRIRTRRQHKAAPGGTHDRIVRAMAVVLPGLIGVLLAVMVLTPLAPRGEISFLLDPPRWRSCRTACGW
jgi:hypothetical protein